MYIPLRHAGMRRRSVFVQCVTTEFELDTNLQDYCTGHVSVFELHILPLLNPASHETAHMRLSLLLPLTVWYDAAIRIPDRLASQMLRIDDS